MSGVASVEKRSARIEGEWRCATCGHGEHLSAWAEANIAGPLGRDSLVLPLEVEQHGGDDVYESSVQCDRHPDGALERWYGGHWCRWTTCEDCAGSGEGDPDPNRSTISTLVRRPCKSCRGYGGKWSSQPTSPLQDSEGQLGLEAVQA